MMSDGNELQRSDAVTGNVHRPTVVSRNGGTSSLLPLCWLKTTLFISENINAAFG